MEEDRIYLEEVSKEEFDKIVAEEEAQGIKPLDVSLEDLVSKEELESEDTFEIEEYHGLSKVHHNIEVDPDLDIPRYYI